MIFRRETTGKKKNTEEKDIASSEEEGQGREGQRPYLHAARKNGGGSPNKDYRKKKPSPPRDGKTENLLRGEKGK